MLPTDAIESIRGSKPAWLVLHWGGAQKLEERVFRMSLWGHGQQGAHKDAASLCMPVRGGPP